MAKTMSYIICPICAHNLSLKRTGKARKKYNVWNKEQPIVYIRDCPGGKKPHEKLPKGKGPKPGWPPGSGFPIIERIGWDEALENEEYKQSLIEIKQQIQKLSLELLNKTEKEKLIKKLS